MLLQGFAVSVGIQNGLFEFFAGHFVRSLFPFENCRCAVNDLFKAGFVNFQFFQGYRQAQFLIEFSHLVAQFKLLVAG